jgi:hypothetical protein
MILRPRGAGAPKRLQENNRAEDGQIVTTAPNIGRVLVSSFGTDGWNRFRSGRNNDIHFDRAGRKAINAHH